MDRDNFTFVAQLLTPSDVIPNTSIISNVIRGFEKLRLLYVDGDKSNTPRNLFHFCWKQVQSSEMSHCVRAFKGADKVWHLKQARLFHFTVQTSRFEAEYTVDFLIL